jgi:hypothetical protein
MYNRLMELVAPEATMFVVAKNHMARLIVETGQALFPETLHREAGQAWAEGQLKQTTDRVRGPLPGLLAAQAFLLMERPNPGLDQSLCLAV